MALDRAFQLSSSPPEIVERDQTLHTERLAGFGNLCAVRVVRHVRHVEDPSVLEVPAHRLRRELRQPLPHIEIHAAHLVTQLEREAVFDQHRRVVAHAIEPLTRRKEALEKTHEVRLGERQLRARKQCRLEVLRDLFLSTCGALPEVDRHDRQRDERDRDESKRSARTRFAGATGPVICCRPYWAHPTAGPFTSRSRARAHVHAPAGLRPLRTPLREDGSCR